MRALLEGNVEESATDKTWSEGEEEGGRRELCASLLASKDFLSLSSQHVT